MLFPPIESLQTLKRIISEKRTTAKVLSSVLIQGVHVDGERINLMIIIVITGMIPIERTAINPPTQLNSFLLKSAIAESVTVITIVSNQKGWNIEYKMLKLFQRPIQTLP